MKTRNSRGHNDFTNSTDLRLTKSVVSNLAASLQELTTDFRKNQNLYLKSKRRSRPFNQRLLGGLGRLI